MSLLEEMALAAGVEDLVRRRRRKTMFGIDRRLALLALLGAGVAITVALGWFQGHRAEGREHSAEHPELAA